MKRTDLQDTSEAAHRMMLRLLRLRSPEQKVKMLDERMEEGRVMRRFTEHLRSKKAP
ncbi:MAG: hypothetical protein H7Y17_03675 [Chlorobia bacterium]|nr:hypothetical protein [Fimbriimonadaceae bacterium]